MPKDNVAGIGEAISKLLEINDVPAEKLQDALGDSLFTAIQQNDYNYITLADMQKVADLFGLVFVMNFQSIDNLYRNQGAGDNHNEQ